MGTPRTTTARLRTEAYVPSPCALVKLTPSQKLFLLGIVLWTGAGFLADYQRALTAAIYCFSGLYLVICLHKLVLIIAGMVRGREVKISKEEIIACRDWPGYTVLLPVYREANILRQLCRAVENLDYPREKLEVLLLLEEDDHETIAAAEAVVLPAWWKKVVVPDYRPKTKGKALDYGLRLASGVYTVIYDAEDIPDRDQIKKAVVAFRKMPDDVVCLQAKLDYYNPGQNLLTEWFTAEYSTWFNLYLPGIDGIQAPVPLGGTSNHFKTAVLRALEGWDPYNVTEDCDLGVRIAVAGGRTGILDSTTWEEANSRLPGWLKQRSRWVKGYIQTFFVHLRDPFTLLRKLGPLNFFHFLVIIGGNFLVLCLNPIAWLLLIVWVAGCHWWVFPNPYFALVTIVLLAGNGFFMLVGLLGVLRRKYHRLIPSCCFLPVYWALMSIGAWKGLLQYLHRPHFWEKTDHELFAAEQCGSEEVQTLLD